MIASDTADQAIAGLIMFVLCGTLLALFLYAVIREGTSHGRRDDRERQKDDWRRHM